MAPILVDDTKTRSVGTYGPELNRELTRISQHQVMRLDAIESLANLRFLVYDGESGDNGENDDDGVNDDGGEDDDVGGDDDVEDKPGKNANKNDQSRVLAVGRNDDVKDGDARLRPLSPDELAKGDCPESEGVTSHQSDREASHAANDEGSEDEATEPGYNLVYSVQPFYRDGQSQDSVTRASGAVKELSRAVPSGTRSTTTGKAAFSCETCFRYPTFPYLKRANRFRVVQLDASDGPPCDHYLTISYCWSSPWRAPKRSYRVRIVEGNGTVFERPNRAPDEIIDRAVELAKLTGVRLIWLDQECLPQDNSRGQELGIQAMDLVYSRAWVTGELLESTIPSQAHMDSVMSVLDWGQPNTITQRTPQIPPTSDLTEDTWISCLLDFLEILAFDLWNQRAWTLQESFSSTTSTILEVRMAAPFVIHAPWCLEFPVPPDRIYMIPREVIALIKNSQQFLELVLGPLGTSYLPNRAGDMRSALLDRAENVFNALQERLPRTPDTGTPEMGGLMDDLVVPRQNPSGRRYNCNAAEALSFLRTRSNNRPADRLAILANMCNYEVRLNTALIENNFKSLTICLFCLAYINNDFSLLVPEIYQSSKVQAPIQGPSWAFPFCDIFCTISKQHIPAGHYRCLRLVNPCKFTDSGIITPGHMWKVDRSVDLTCIQSKWKTHWEQHTSMATLCDPRGNESTQKVSRLYDRAFQQRSDSRQLLGDILFDILSYLNGIGERLLANSIWHSVRIDSLKRDRGHGQPPEHVDLPDEVTDLLVDRDLVADPESTLQLNHSNGTISEVWLINRIMKDGLIWVGNCTTRGLPPQDGADHVSKSIAGRQRALRYLASFLETTIPSATRSDNLEMNNVANYALFAYMLSAPRAALENMVATFDVDEPCEVFTPYDGDMEGIPRSAIRSWSVCSVVESIRSEVNKNTSDGSPGKGDTSASVVNPETGNNESTKAQTGDTKGKRPAMSEENDMSQDDGSEEDMANDIPANVEDQEFRVLKRVKGMWQFLEPLGANYKFV